MVACSKQTLEEKALDLLESSEVSLSKQLGSKEVVLSNDSICVIHFMCDNKTMEYILISLSEKKEGFPAGVYEYTHDISGIKRMVSVMDIGLSEAFSKYEWSRFSKEDIEERPEMIYYQNALDLIMDNGVMVDD